MTSSNDYYDKNHDNLDELIDNKQVNVTEFKDKNYILGNGVY